MLINIYSIIKIVLFALVIALYIMGFIEYKKGERKIAYKIFITSLAVLVFLVTTKYNEYKEQNSIEPREKENIIKNNRYSFT